MATSLETITAVFDVYGVNKTPIHMLETEIARQLTPLDVAVTHVEIVRRKGDEYTVEERDNVLSIVESHVKEARAALFALLAAQNAVTACCCPAGSYNPGNVHEDYCPLADGAK